MIVFRAHATTLHQWQAQSFCAKILDKAFHHSRLQLQPDMSSRHEIQVAQTYAIHKLSHH